MSSIATLPRPPAPSSPSSTSPPLLSFPFASRPASASPGIDPSHSRPSNASAHNATPRTSFVASFAGGDNQLRAAPGVSDMTSTPARPPSSFRIGSTVNKIEQIIESILDDINRGKELRIPFSRRARQRERHTSSQRLSSAQNRSDTPSFVSFPGKTEAESKLFTQVLSILQLSHQALLSGTFVTKRNIFYQYRDLFRDQRVVDGLVDDIAYTLSLGRDTLNIVAASVGMGIVIPPVREIQELDLSACQWVLVIEKEATFRTLAASGYWNTSMAGPGALVTSKGYPTLVTRWFLHHIHETAPRLPIYGLVDYDPHGVRIFRTYKYGSQSLSHESNTTVPGMKWLGIQSDDLIRSRSSGTFRGGWSALDDVLPLTETDRRTAVCLLKDMVYSSEGDPDSTSLEQCREVQVMLMLNVKAEIQAADDYGDLAAWLEEKLYRAQEGILEEM